MADVVCAHPSISKQHAVLQYRSTVSKADNQLAVRPYIMDLGTANGTFLNGERIESERFYELLVKVCGEGEVQGRGRAEEAGQGRGRARTVALRE